MTIFLGPAQTSGSVERGPWHRIFGEMASGEELCKIRFSARNQSTLRAKPSARERIFVAAKPMGGMPARAFEEMRRAEVF